MPCGDEHECRRPSRVARPFALGPPIAHVGAVTHLSIRSLSLTCLLLACSSEPVDEPAPTEPGGAETPTTQGEPPPAAEPPADAVLRARAIATDAGDQPVWLGNDGAVHVGSLTVSLGDDHVGPGDVYTDFWRQASLAVVSFDASREAIVLALPTRDEEDPPNH